MTESDYGALIDAMLKRSDGRLDADVLRLCFYKRMSWRTLVEVLCNYITARDMLKDADGAIVTGEQLIEIEALKAENGRLRSESNGLYSRLMNTMGELHSCRERLLTEQKARQRLENEAERLRWMAVLNGTGTSAGEVRP
ncbi:MAG TPA: hypothetical protein IAB18_02830 [Candidatus Avisuccinivibrio pullicola]|nr:hypothetical protein [Candidatus Avisuccinivibrio pullicola]